MATIRVPAGYRFLPRDDELVLHFLLPRMTNTPLAIQGLIQDCDLYGEIHPWELFKGRETENTGYFFTKLKKKSTEAKVAIRTVGNKDNGGGTWKSQAKGTNVIDDKGIIIGKKSSFSYICQGKSEEEWGRWNMKEYSLDGVLLGSALPEFKDVVLCRIRNLEDSKKRKRNSETDNGSATASTSTFYQEQPNSESACMGTQSTIGISIDINEYAITDDRDIMQEQQHDNILWEGITDHQQQQQQQQPIPQESGTLNQISTDQGPKPCDGNHDALLEYSWSDIAQMQELPDSLFGDQLPWIYSDFL